MVASSVLLPLLMLEPILISGRFSMWTSNICKDQTELCELPKPLGQSWVATFSYLRPIEIGKSKIVDETYVSNEVIIHFSQYWVQRPQPEVSYLITQITLARKGQGPIAVCSRYDSVDVFSFLPPGACSGRDGDQLLGISISKP